MKRSISPLRRLALAASALTGLMAAAPATAGAVDMTWAQDRDVAGLGMIGVGRVRDLRQRGVDEGVGHFFSPSPAFGSGPASGDALPAPVSAVLSASFFA